ncbi:MAG: ABC transporter permease subunit [Candidatus Hydrogenedentes bacterium]|nr:ABC transporter permease subunit [Candidatus Hydrogenedentota bacterium]
MTRRIVQAYLFEMYKVIHYKYSAMGPVLVLIAVVCAPLLYPISKDEVSDYGFIAYITPVALNFLGFLLLLIYSAGLVSTELASGTIRQVLIRPVRRHEFVLAKLLNGMTYALLLTLIVGASSWLLAWLLGELMGVTYGGELLFTREEMSNAYLLGLLLSLAPQWAGVALALMFSSFFRSPMTAASGAVGGWILIDLVKYPLGIERFVFSTYLEKPWAVFSSRSEAIALDWFPGVWYVLGTSFAVMAVCTALAIVALQRRNLSA